MPSVADELAARVRRFAIRIVKFARAMSRDGINEIVVRQLAKAATSASANYSAARRGRSRAEFIAKLGVVVEEADETEHWLKVLMEVDVPMTSALRQELEWLIDEASKLRAIFVASVKTARKNTKGRNSNRKEKSPQ